MKIKYVSAAVVLLCASFFLTACSQSTDNTQNSPTPTSSRAVLPKEFTLVVKDKKLISGPETLNVTQGDEVMINITSDEAEELHLHGYDKSIDLEKNTPAKLTFTANIAGHFPYELEHAKLDIGALEVQPQ